MVQGLNIGTCLKQRRGPTNYYVGRRDLRCNGMFCDVGITLAAITHDYRLLRSLLSLSSNNQASQFAPFP